MSIICNRLVATIFSSLAFLSSSVYMAKLSCLVAASFSSLALLSSSISTANLRCLLVKPSPVLDFSPTHFHHLASIFIERLCFVSRGLLFLTTFSFPLVICWLYFLLYLFRVLSSAFFFPLFLVSEALFALSIPFSK